MLGNLQPLLQGAVVTIEISALAILLGCAAAVAVAVVRQSIGGPLGWLAAIYVSFVRGTPLFVQILMIYFLLPAIGLDISQFWAGVVALGLNSGAYISEMIRGALSTIPKGQIEAARALGMPARWIWVRITLPQVFSIILPPLTVELSALLKGSALLSVIGVVELTRKAQQVISVTFDPIGTWIPVAIIYFCICFSMGLLARTARRLTTAAVPQ